jgi:putative nucleotidyltransferase with HDIG domain
VITQPTILARIQAIPALSGAAGRLLVLMQDPACDVNALVKGIEADPGLTASLLKMANAPLFGVRSPIATVRQAVVMLGLGRTRRAVLACTVAGRLNPAVKGYDLAPAELLRCAVAAAVAAEELALELKTTPPPAAFAAALLRDVGKVVMGTFLEVDGRNVALIAAKERIPFEEAERRVLGVDHAEIGAKILENWRLPESVVEPVRWHHDPDRCTEHQQTADLVHAADYLVLTTGLGAGLDGLQHRIAASVKERLQLTTEVIESVLSRLVDRMSAMMSLLDVCGGNN